MAERFRNEQDPEAAHCLGDELGRMVFGGGCRKSSAGTTYLKACGNIRSSGCVIARSVSRISINSPPRVDTRPQVPEGDWYKDFGSFKIWGSGSYPTLASLGSQQ
jgi:hypothetical protein